MEMRTIFSIFIASSVSLLSTISFAAGMPIDKFLNRANLIAVVRVEKGSRLKDQEDNCRNEYELSSITNVRGSTPSKMLTSGTLEIGSEYLIALAERTPWFQRRIGDDASMVARSYEPNCGRKRPDEIVAAAAEIFRIVKVSGGSSLLMDPNWIVVAPNLLGGSAAIKKLSDFDRVEIKSFQSSEPSIDEFDYFRLSEIISFCKSELPTGED